jgi:hypothetical protein
VRSDRIGPEFDIQHLKQTEHHMKRLEQVFEKLGEELFENAGPPASLIACLSSCCDSREIRLRANDLRFEKLEHRHRLARWTVP